MKLRPIRLAPIDPAERPAGPDPRAAARPPAGREAALEAPVREAVSAHPGVRTAARRIRRGR